MRNIICILILFLPVLSLAQDSTSTEKEGVSVTEADEARFLKNEFGLALNPVLTVFMGASMNETRLALAYRRHLNEKFAFRFIVGFNFALYDQDDKLLYQDDETNYNADSSTRTIFNSYYDIYKGFQLNSGMEFRWGKKKLKWFTGIDLTYIHANSTSKTDRINQELDTTVVSSFDFYRTVSMEEFNRNTKISNHIGLMPFIGVRAMFNKHWGFTTHFGFIGTIARTTSIWYFSGIEQPDSYKYTSYNFDSIALFQDVSLVFRF
jgi:hypothetical protein